MRSIAIAAQVWIAISIVFVWVYHFPVVVAEFQEYKLPDWIRSSIGAAKIALSTLLVAGIWFPSLVVGSALAMAFLMVAAQWFHFRARHPLQKYMPSLILLLLSLFVAGVYSGVVHK